MSQIYFGFAEADGEGLAGGVVAAEGEGDGFATGLVPAVGAAAAGVTAAAGSGGLMLSSSTSKIKVAFGPII